LQSGYPKSHERNLNDAFIKRADLPVSSTRRGSKRYASGRRCHNQEGAGYAPKQPKTQALLQG
jgi:hypothetical protein